MFVPRANKNVANKVVEWADIVGFATREHSAATGSGNRVIFTAPTKRATAKSRLALEERMELSFAPIAEALKLNSKKETGNGKNE
jgi:hypothetical protein